MVNFIKQQRENLLNNVIRLIREKYELVQTINILKQSLSTEIAAIEQQLKTEEKLEKNLAANEIDIKFYITQIKKNEIEKIKTNIENLEKK